jgi:hypothetical protein
MQLGFRLQFPAHSAYECITDGSEMIVPIQSELTVCLPLDIGFIQQVLHLDREVGTWRSPTGESFEMSIR